MIAEFLRATAPRPWRWGVCDCATWAADLVERATGHDPAAPWRGSYATRFEARQLILRAGGLHALIAPRMAGHGPAVDGWGVAVIRVRGVSVCAVLARGRAVLKTDGGLRQVGAFEIVEGWDICRRP